MVKLCLYPFLTLRSSMMSEVCRGLVRSDGLRSGRVWSVWFRYGASGLGAPRGGKAW